MARDPPSAERGPVHPRLAAVATSRGGIFSSADAGRCGVGPSALERLRKDHLVVRVRRGAYVLAEPWRAASPEERHRLTTRAILLTRPPADAASHHAAVLLHGVDTWGVDLGVVDVASGVRAVRRRGTLRSHPRPLRATSLVGCARCVPLPLALLQTSAWSGVVPGVCSLDDALHDERCTLGDLRGALTLLPEHEQGAAGAALRRVDARSESVGETRTRLLLLDLGLRVESQVPLTLPSGARARADLVVEGVVVVEFDGLVKYAGADGRHALAAEKQRERGIWDLGYEVERVIWSELDRPARLYDRVRAAEHRALARGLLPGTRRNSHGTGELPGAVGASAWQLR